MVTQAQINADNLKKLIFKINRIESRQEEIYKELLKMIDTIDKINNMLLYLHKKEKKDDIKTEEIKSGWFY